MVSGVGKAGRKRGLAYNPRILVLGSTSFFGKNLLPILEETYPNADIICDQGSKFFDLTHPGHAGTLFNSIIKNHGYIDYVINLAAYSGGMFENMQHQAGFWYRNTMINANVLIECQKARVANLLFPIGGCSYPNEPVSEDGIFREEDLFAGFVHMNSFGYSMAKKNALVGAMAYNSEFGLNSNVLIPTNPIGPWDNTDSDNAHVPMALIGRFLEAKKEGYSTVTVLGSGKPERDFIFIDDVVKLFPVFLENCDEVGPWNISTGKATTIQELAETISRVVGFEGKIHFDRSKPDGQMRKVLDNSKLKAFLEKNNITWDLTPLEEAVAKTVEWYEKRVTG
jgi:GDP-L-fucose synthase